MLRFFKNCETAEELKALYRRLAMANHPDKGGDSEVMKAINAEYDRAWKLFGSIHRDKDGKKYQKRTEEKPGDYRDIIEKTMKMDGVRTEIIGAFIWCTGETIKYTEALKKLGFKWHAHKKCWFKAPDWYHKRGGGGTLDQIRAKYGVSFDATGNIDKIEAEV